MSVVNNRQYDVFPDGKRFVVVYAANRQDSRAAPTAQIEAVPNWTQELKARVPSKTH